MPEQPRCDGCKEIIGWEYFRECSSCDRTYCEKCLNKDPHFSADAEIQGDPPRWVDLSRLEICLQCVGTEAAL